MLRIPMNEVITTNKAERKQLDAKEKEQLELFQKMMRMDLPNVQIPEIKPTVPLDIYPKSPKKSEYPHLPYCKVSDIADAGCGPLALEYAFRANGMKVNFPKFELDLNLYLIFRFHR